MPITITITGETAEQVTHLTQDMAYALGRIHLADIPVDVKVSTLDEEPTGQAAHQFTPPPAVTMAAPVQVQTPVQTAVPTVAPTAVPIASQTYTFDQLGVASTQIRDAGRMPELVALLQSFGVPSLKDLPKEQYGAFAIGLRQLGARI